MSKNPIANLNILLNLEESSIDFEKCGRQLSALGQELEKSRQIDVADGQYMRNDSARVMLMTMRQARIMEIGAIEDFLGMPRTVVPRRKREG